MLDLRRRTGPQSKLFINIGQDHKLALAKLASSEGDGLMGRQVERLIERAIVATDGGDWRPKVREWAAEQQRIAEEEART